MRERSDLKPTDFPSRRRLFGAEGGTVFLAERDACFYVITDESAMFDMLSEEDQQGLSPATVREFETDAEREAYLEARRWRQRGHEGETA